LLSNLSLESPITIGMVLSRVFQTVDFVAIRISAAVPGFGESNALDFGEPEVGAGPRGDRSHELSRHYPFDLLVLRGTAVAACGE
jgi:hypothetical protein